MFLSQFILFMLRQLAVEGNGLSCEECQVHGAAVSLKDLRRGESPFWSLPLHPWVLQNLGSAESLLRISNQELRDEVFGLGGDVSPVFVGKLVFAFLDALEQLVLAHPAYLSPVPAAVSPTVTGVVSSGVVMGVQELFNFTPLPKSKSQIFTGDTFSGDSHNMFSGFRSR